MESFNWQSYQQFVESNLTIVNKDGVEVPYLLNEAQVDFLKNITGRDIILKARQLGFSSLILAVMTTRFLLKRNERLVCISHEAGATQRLLDRVKFYIGSYEKKNGIKIPMKYNSRNEMNFGERNNTFYIGTAGSKTFGRGDTISVLHGCLSPDTEIILKDGFVKPISEVKIGETVINGNGGLSEVKRIWINNPKKLGHKEMIRLKVGNNHDTISLTPNHKVLVKCKKFSGRQYKWIETGKLKEGDCLVAPIKNAIDRFTKSGRNWKQGKKYYWAKILEIEKEKLPEKVYDIEIEDSCHSFLTVCGVVHNSEAAFYDDINGFMAGAVQAVVPSGLVFLETTANGFNDFKNLWDRSEKNESGYKTHFYSPKWEYGPEFLETKKRELKDLYLQEYPENAIEAFVNSGNMYFSRKALQHYLLNIGEPINKNLIYV
jgi:hypothetical protein